MNEPRVRLGPSLTHRESLPLFRGRVEAVASRRRAKSNSATSLWTKVQTQPRWRWVLAGLLVVGLGLTLFLVLNTDPAPDSVPDEPGVLASRASPPLPLTPTQFHNATLDVAYVGIAACAQCHPAEFESYQRTQHSRSLADIDLTREPPDGAFFHAPSQRSYRVVRDRGQLWHRESIKLEESELVLAEYPMRLAFGSGTHTRSYVTEIDGFLIESPITWYPAASEWGISPGYDRADHWAFERITSLRCVLCHAGDVERTGPTPNRLAIHTPAISCERCHGPGALHADRWREPDAEVAVPDLTIVHPGRLSRELKEAICAQCHVGNAAAVDVRGHGIEDFRPGRPLTDFRVDYDFDDPVEGMTVVGHFRQMHQSRCYQQTDTLSCTTCHHPHAKPLEEERVHYYRAKCLACHDDPGSACAFPEPDRLARNAEDDCSACHMPKSATSVPHTAFTHHRIGIHEEDAPPSPALTNPGQLVPSQDIAHFPEIERARCLGLAYLHVSGDAQFEAHATVYHQRGLELLEDVRQRGLRDPEVDSSLANLYWRQNPRQAIALAEAALAYAPPSPDARVEALFVLGTSHFDAAIPPRTPFDALFLVPTDRFDRTRLARAQDSLEELVTLRRDPEDWLLLSICRRVGGDQPGALQAAEKASEISPGNPMIHAILALIHEQSGNRDEAATHRRWAEVLAQQTP